MSPGCNELQSQDDGTFFLSVVTDFKNITIIVNPTPDSPFSFYDNYMHEAGTREFPYLPQARDISICYIDPVDSECQLTVRWFPLLCASGALIVKATIAFIALRKHSHFHRRIFNCLGDMIAVGGRHPRLRSCPQAKNVMFKEEPCHRLRIRWKDALGWLDFLIALVWWVSSLGALVLGVYEFMHAGGSLSWNDRYKRFGLGTIDPATSISSGETNAKDGNASTFPLQIIIANLPQLWLSLGYLFWNNQISRIWMEREWRSFYAHRMKPRVSYPLESRHPGVRETRWLQLPYWLTFILMVVSTVLHWLTSQTLFVVEILASSQKAPNFYLYFSPLAIFCTGLLSTVLVLGMMIYYFYPVKTWMPLMAGSLLVVFEACLHLPQKAGMDESLVWDLPDGGVMFGDISTARERLAGFGTVTTDLVEGAVYPSDRELEPRNLRNRGSVLTFASSGYSDRAPLLRPRYYG